MNQHRILVPLAIAIVVHSLASAESWTQYRGTTGDGRSPASISDTPWAGAGPKILWKVPTPLGFSSFTVSEGRAFSLIAVNGDDSEKDEACIALDADTGRELWRTTLGASDYGRGGGNAGAPGNRGGDGPRSTPVTDGQRVYVYDAHLVLTCLDAADGRQVWQRDIVAELEGRNVKWANGTSPILDGNSIFIAGGGKGASFLAINKDDGSVIWQSGDESMTHATPQIAEVNGVKQVIYFMQSGLVGIDLKTGKELWRTKFPFSTSSAASPVVEKNQVYCSAGYGVGAGLFSIDGDDEADEIWFKPNELMNHWSTPVVHDGHLYGLYECKKYGKAPLQCVELATGKIKWTERGFGPGNCILVGDKLVVLSDAGKLVIVRARADGYDELAQAEILSGKCWSTPAYADGRVYIRSTEEAACVEVK